MDHFLSFISSERFPTQIEDQFLSQALKLETPKTIHLIRQPILPLLRTRRPPPPYDRRPTAY